MDPDLSLISALPDTVKRRIHDYLSHASNPVADKLTLGALKSTKIWLHDRFLADSTCQVARLEAERVLEVSGRPAGMGGAAGTCHNTAFRGDRTCWLEPEQAEHPALRAACHAVLALRKGLEAEGFDVGGKPSIQLACYPGKGTSYAKHVDASGSALRRTLTAILYLNLDWHQGSGGELCLYNHTQGGGRGYTHGEPGTLVPPVGGRIVVFDSRLCHEVLPAHTSRYALTIWFRKGTEAASCSQAPGNGNAPERPSTPQAPASSSLQRIFISIAAFRDPETRWTVRDLLQKATEPDRLRIAIVWQTDSALEADLTDLAISASQKRQIREIRLDYREATGPCKARALAQKLWAGEEYYLQLDAHMRFAPGWDHSLIQWLHQAEAGHPGTRPVISTYPPAYEGQGQDAQIPPDDRPVLLCASHFGPEGMLRLKGARLAQRAGAPVPSLFWAAGFSFSRSQLLTEVPYQDLPFLFFGEEQSMLARMWTRGYDMYTPPRSIAWHLWSRSHRHTFHSCVPQDSHLKARSQEQVLHLFSCAQCSTSRAERQSTCGISLGEPAPGLGTKRSCTEFQTTVGVDYIKRQIHPAACRGCRLVDHIELASDSVHSDLISIEVVGITPTPASMA